MAIENNKRIEEIIIRLREMRMPIMAEVLMASIENEEFISEEMIDLLEKMTQEELMSRKNNTIQRLKKKAKLSQMNARIEEIDFSPQRGIKKEVLEQLSTNKYIQNHRNVVILGACGTGKSYISNALGNNACDHSYSVLYTRMFEMLADTNTSMTYGVDSLKELINTYVKPDLLIIDDFLISSITSKETETIFKILEYRNKDKSTIINSQLEPEEWHKSLGGSILADSILDRILPKAYQIILNGDSLRK